MNQIQWFKGAKELSKRDYTITHTDGVITLEIIDCKPEDSGKYRCVATNKHGTDETSCVVIVEGNETFVFEISSRFIVFFLKRCAREQ